jgi:hypothetical protein
MKRRYALILGVVLGLVGSVLGFATIGHTATQPERFGPPIGPRMPKDSGPGEILLAVVGGVYATEADAQAANAQMSFGELQGYYVTPVGQFVGLGKQLGVEEGFALVTVFRTEQGATEFVEFARSLGLPATLYSERVKSFGGVYAGLGQETNPEGTGPLLGPVPESLPVGTSGP